MQKLMLTQLKPGQKIGETVVTSLGGALFYKGHVLTEQDLQILKSFFVDAVTIETAKPTPAPQQVKKDKAPEIKPVSKPVEENDKGDVSVLELEYRQVVKRTERMFLNIQGGTPVPVMEIRQYLIPFVIKALEESSTILSIPKLSSINQYFYHHAVAAAVVVSHLAKKMGYNPKELPQIALAGYLHNIGQLRIDPTIITKTTPLSQEEFQMIQNHPTYGYDMLKNITGISESVRLAALQHHEREDGSGYPSGYTSIQINDYAKMVAIADIYVAMCTERVYKKGLSPFLVIEQVKNDSFGKLNPRFVHVFVELVTNHLSLGSKVKLNNGVLGEVVFTDVNSPTRPILNINGEIINLQSRRELYIEEVLIGKK